MCLCLCISYNSDQTEHIDNPKGYGDGEDARKYHPMLRGPVDVGLARLL
jgi:hypothetical protein